MSDLDVAAQIALDAMAGGDDRACIAAVVGLLAHPLTEVVAWLSADVLAGAQGRPDADLDALIARRMPEPGLVGETVRALRTGDAARLVALAGEPDPVAVVVHLAATAAALS